jgi:predicted RNA binding protein YcfA (HicA-like mRNA interferase family)
MTRRLYNWAYRDVIAFLKENGFTFLKPLKGSHEAWGKRGNDDNKPHRRVEVNLTHGSYPAVTLKLMIRQSGIPQAEWIKWGSS